MGQGIQDFYRVAVERGFSRNHQFVLVDVPVSTGGVPLIDSKNKDYMAIYATSLELPALKNNTLPLGFRGFEFNIPQMTNYSNSKDWKVDFYMDENLHNHKFVYGNLMSSYFLLKKDARMELADQNGRGLMVAVVNDQFSPVYSFVLHGAFIKEFSPVKYDRGGNGEPQKITVTYSFQYESSIWLDSDNRQRPGLLDTIEDIVGKVKRVISSGRRNL